MPRSSNTFVYVRELTQAESNDFMHATNRIASRLALAERSSALTFRAERISTDTKITLRWQFMGSNDEVERREVASTRNEAALSKSSTTSLAHRDQPTFATHLGAVAGAPQ